MHWIRCMLARLRCPHPFIAYQPEGDDQLIGHCLDCGTYLRTVSWKQFLSEQLKLPYEDEAD